MPRARFAPAPGDAASSRRAPGAANRRPLLSPQAANAARAWFSSLPAVTRATVATLILTHAARVVVGRPAVASLCLGAVRGLRAPYRLFSAPLTHLGLAHLAFNSWALVPSAGRRERGRRCWMGGGRQGANGGGEREGEGSTTQAQRRSTKK